jgi:hypothetical protein
LVQAGYAVEGQEGVDLMKLSIPAIIKMFVDDDDALAVDSIPMSGANDNINADGLYRPY